MNAPSLSGTQDPKHCGRVISVTGDGLPIQFISGADALRDSVVGVAVGASVEGMLGKASLQRLQSGALPEVFRTIPETAELTRTLSGQRSSFASMAGVM